MARADEVIPSGATWPSLLVGSSSCDATNLCSISTSAKATQGIAG